MRKRNIGIVAVLATVIGGGAFSTQIQIKK